MLRKSLNTMVKDKNIVIQKKEENMSENKKKNKGQLFVKIMAAVLAGLMVLATCGTVIFYLVSR